jgi:hypothetical protein
MQYIDEQVYAPQKDNAEYNPKAATDLNTDFKIPEIHRDLPYNTWHGITF